jgi:hypothetical protein
VIALQALQQDAEAEERRRKELDAQQEAADVRQRAAERWGLTSVLLPVRCLVLS